MGKYDESTRCLERLNALHRALGWPELDHTITNCNLQWEEGQGWAKALAEVERLKKPTRVWILTSMNEEDSKLDDVSVTVHASAEIAASLLSQELLEQIAEFGDDDPEAAEKAELLAQADSLGNLSNWYQYGTNGGNYRVSFWGEDYELTSTEVK